MLRRYSLSGLISLRRVRRQRAPQSLLNICCQDSYNASSFYPATRAL